LVNIAYEFKISPLELLKLDERMLWTMGRFLIWRAQELSKK